MKKIINYIIPVLVVLLLFSLLGIIGYAYLKNHRSEHSTSSASTTEQTNSSSDGNMSSEKWSEGTISYKGKKYIYNSNLDIYLLMGIDNDDPVEAATDSTAGGQADALFLLAADREKESITIVAIHRNTMTQIQTCDEEGNDTGYVEAQICTQHGFGDGKKLSCIRTVDAMSNLFYGLPIDGYFSLNIGGIESLNSVVGGVELKILENVQNDEVNLVKGQTVTLTDRQAYNYLHYRDITVFDTASGRLERQKQYIDKYIQKLKKQVSEGTIAASKLYNTVTDYCVTDMPLSNVIDTLMGYEYNSDQMYSLDGEVVQNGEFEEFHVDDEALYQLIIDLFYVEIQ